ncbi:MAG: hypothetical protein M3490_09985 [Chloroflexota bacterium]|nr:hypothetical protein [Chloroflexota bacterium]
MFSSYRTIQPPLRRLATLEPQPNLHIFAREAQNPPAIVKEVPVRWKQRVEGIPLVQLPRTCSGEESLHVDDQT